MTTFATAYQASDDQLRKEWMGKSATASTTVDRSMMKTSSKRFPIALLSIIPMAIVVGSLIAQLV